MTADASTRTSHDAASGLLGYAIGSLCSGIGGLDLGLERAGVGRTVWQCEIDPYARAVLARRWPDATQFEDVTHLCRDVHPRPVDVLAAGFPCQDISLAGPGDGLEGERSSLFYEVMRVTQTINPRFVVLENVAAILGRGLDRVVGVLAALGYDAWWDCVPAAAVGAPHLRDRWFCVAWRRVADGDGALLERGRRPPELVLTPPAPRRTRHQRQRDGHAIGRSGPPLGHRSGPRLAFWQRLPGHIQRQLTAAVGPSGAWPRRGPAQPGLGGAPHGLSAGVDAPLTRRPTATASDADGSGSRQAGDRAKPGLSLTDAVLGDGGRGRGRARAWEPPEPEPWERGVPRVAPVGDTAVRRGRLRGLGNAVVPLVGEVIGLVLLDLDHELRGLAWPNPRSPS